MLRRADSLLIAAMALATGLAAAWLIPLGLDPSPSCAPDELAHFEYVEALVSGRFESWPENDNRMAMFPPGQYMFQSFGLLLARTGLDVPALYRFRGTQRKVRGYPMARLGSVLLGAAAVLLLANATALATGSRRAALLVGTIATLYPQRLFISGYVNNDVFTLACGAFLLMTLARWVRAGEGARHLAWVGAACGLLSFAKPSGYALLVPTLIWVAWAGIRGRAPRTALLRALGAWAMVALPMLIWNALRNGGDPTGVETYRVFVASLRGSEELVFPTQPIWVFFRALVASSFMKFGNQSLGLPMISYLPWLILVALGLALLPGMLRGANARQVRMACWFGGSLALSFSVIVYQCFFVDFSPQGRYVLIAVLTLTLLCCLVIVEGFHRSRRVIELLMVMFFALVALQSLQLLVSTPCGPGILLPG